MFHCDCQLFTTDDGTCKEHKAILTHKRCNIPPLMHQCSSLLHDRGDKKCLVRCGVDAGWWTKPDFVINELNVQSVITAPAHDELVPMQAASNYTVKGFAYSGHHPLNQVLICLVVT